MPRSRRAVRWQVVLLLIVLAAGGGFVAGRATAPVVPSAAAPSPSVSVPPVDAPPVTGSLEDRVLALRPQERVPDAPYRRDAFGARWADVDRNGCDTRNDVLGRDLTDVTFRDARACKVDTGVLTDPYDGTRVEFVAGPVSSQTVQIDHVVALSWAWRNGADLWPDAARLQFANDPANLVAASAATNQSKRDHGPGRWLPEEPLAQCVFVEQFVGIVSRWDLSIDEQDRDAALRVARACR